MTRVPKKQPVPDRVNTPINIFPPFSYRKGSVGVAEVDHMPNVSDVMKKVVKHFEAFVLASKYEPFNTVSQKGMFVLLFYF